MTVFARRNVTTSALVGGRFWEAEHDAINGQTLSQSEPGALSGQHGMSSGMAAAVATASTSAPTSAGMLVGIAMAGRASGATSNPATASVWRKAPMVKVSLTISEIAHRACLAKQGKVHRVVKPPKELTD
jgi:hypothetical protein